MPETCKSFQKPDNTNPKDTKATRAPRVRDFGIGVFLKMVTAARRAYSKVALQLHHGGFLNMRRGGGGGGGRPLHPQIVSFSTPQPHKDTPLLSVGGIGFRFRA